MATIERADAPERFLLYDVSWKTYEMLLRDRGERSRPRMTYDRGRLELMSPTDEHEEYKHFIGLLVVFWAIAKRIPQRGLGSMTIRKRRKLRGLEPDQCYYVLNELAVRGKRKLDLSIDPPPDLAIEIDISRSSLNKLKIYAALGVPEVWLFDGESLRVHELADGVKYRPREGSLNLPGFPIAAVPDWINRAFETDETTWLISFQEWARQQPAAGGP